MRLLLDQNLSPRLRDQLQDIGILVAHVRQFGLERADDATVWKYAAEHNFTIVTKDGDFNNLAFLSNAPPKVVWIRLGNCSTADVERLIRSRVATIAEFVDDAGAAVLILQ